MPAQDYTCLRQLGKGSFGRVFLVRHIAENTLWVMKEIDLTASGDAAKARADAIKEVNMLSRLDHPNIVKYRECFQTNTPLTPTPAQGHSPGQAGGNYSGEQQPQAGSQPLPVSLDSSNAVVGDSSIMYIIMEYADSGDLNARIRAQRKPFSEPQILGWFVQLCLAVKHLHDRKCLHRDLKGENVFLSAGDRIKLGDFGISKVLPSTFACAITRIGTPYYLSPEICMNKPYNTASDMWSLGVCLYEMCMLAHPFDATSMEGLLKKIVRVPHRPIHPFYHPELRVLVDALMAKHASKRPTIHEVLRIPIIQREVGKWLTKAEYEREFLSLPPNISSQPAEISPTSGNESHNVSQQIQPQLASAISEDDRSPATSKWLNAALSSASPVPPARVPATTGASPRILKKKNSSVDSDINSWLRAAEDKMKAAEEKRHLAMIQQQSSQPQPMVTSPSSSSIHSKQNRESMASALEKLEKERNNEEAKQQQLSHGPVLPYISANRNEFDPKPVFADSGKPTQPLQPQTSLPPSPVLRSARLGHQLSQPPSPTHHARAIVPAPISRVLAQYGAPPGMPRSPQLADPRRPVAGLDNEIKKLSVATSSSSRRESPAQSPRSSIFRRIRAN